MILKQKLVHKMKHLKERDVKLHFTSKGMRKLAELDELETYWMTLYVLVVVANHDISV